MASTTAGKDTLAQVSKDGELKRKDPIFRNHIGPDSEFEAESGRYHLYISYACPWANRCLAVRDLKGLQDVIGLSVVHPTWKQTRPGVDEHRGWAFASPDDPPFDHPSGGETYPGKDVIPDTINGAKFARDLYEMTGVPPETIPAYSVPILWDKKKGTIVNNESSEIIRMINSEFNAFAKNPDLDLYPEALRPAIDDINKWVYPTINNGVYRCGFATRQAPYEKAFHELFDALDKVEAILAEKRYLVGDTLTEADIRLFMTLIRFDPVYVVYFKTNKKFIHQYPNMREYVKELHALMKDSINIEHIKTHYFTSHPKLNYYGIVPIGCDAWWEEPHNRNETHPIA